MQLRIFACLLCGLFLSAVFPSLSQAEPRIALVIANGNYGGDMGSLKNPVNDGKLIAETLKKIGFNVTLVTDGDQRAMKTAITDFGQKLADAGPTATGLFYYAGHGIQVSGENYLVPVHADIKREGDVDLEAISAEAVLKELDFAGSRIRIVILDACRNNPLMRSFRSANFGLAKIDAPIGSFVAYSTAPGSVAADGQGDNSPFATALADELQRPGQAIEETFRNVRAKVIDATQSQQVPWDSSSLTAPFYFSKNFGGVASSDAVDQEFWDSIKDSGDPADFKAYLTKFPKGAFAVLANNRLKELASNPAGNQVAALTSGSSNSTTRSETMPPPSNMKPGTVFKDCKDCPAMVVIPAGSYMMGSPDSEVGRSPEEGPQHKVTIPRALAFSKYLVTVAEYRKFMNATGRDLDAKCWWYQDDKREWLPKDGDTFAHPGFSQTDDSPAVCINLGDAEAYADWLSKTTGQNYRLPSEAEWEYAARAGTTTARYWGDSDSEQCNYANGADEKYHGALPGDPSYNAACDDGYIYTSPVGTFKPNQFGLYDMLGNAWEFTEDCMLAQYATGDTKGAPVEGSCDKHVIRGGSWGRAAKFLRSATRGGMNEAVRGVSNSIRLVREL